MKKEDQIKFSESPAIYIRLRLYRFMMKLFNPNIPDIMIRTLQASEYIIAEQSAQLADVVIHPDLTGINWYELYQVDKLIKKGEEAALNQLAEIKKLVSE